MRGVQLLTLTALLVQHFVPASALRFLVVGGTGRVGASTAKHLHVLTTDEGRGGADLVLAGRSPEAFERSRARILQQIERIQPAAVPPTVTFQPLDIDTDDVGGLAAAMSSCGADCVVHTAGPFQQRTRPVLLEASIQAGLPYVDVCDEPALCKSSKELHARAVAAGTPCVTAAGIWPGASALMAAEAVTKLRELEGATPTAPCAGEEVEMSFFTAGTGGAGATIVSATFLLLCQAALCYEQGEERDLEPWTSPRAIDFGESVGTRKVWLLDNPDVFTIHDALQVPTLSSRFATAPEAWNLLFGGMKTLVPPSILSNKDLMQGLSLFSLPIIRAVDRLVGATNAMRVDARGARGSHVRFSVTHDDLEQCVGLATAAFALEVLGGGTVAAGVHFPAALSQASRQGILDRVKRGGGGEGGAVVWELETSAP